MVNTEVDYDQFESATNHEATGWQPPLLPPSMAERLAGSIGWTEFAFSAGPFDPLPAGDSAAVTLAFLVGEGFHTLPWNFKANFDPYDLEPFLNNLHFDDLILNARWAGWMFDIPGYDTDGDGNRGRAHLVNCTAAKCDSIFYAGDGVPDFRGPQPPFSPEIELESRPSRIFLRWSGAFTEPEIDPMSGRRDFEGYRVYAGRFQTDDQMSLLANWDVFDFKRMSYDPDEDKWLQSSHPLTPEGWRRALGDPSFDPESYSLPDFSTAFQDTVLDTIRNRYGRIIRITRRIRYSYWKAEGGNRGNSYTEAGYPATNMIQRVAKRDTIIGQDTLCYGIYETTIENLNPAVPLYFSVTTLDFGDYEIGLEPLESLPSNNALYGEPIYSSDVVVDSGLRVSVFPNPYKVIYDGAGGGRTTYYLEGYEGRGIRQFEEQDRRIHFVNLPDTAKISIYSLDGDLIRTINHPDPFLTTYSSSVGWDLVSRNVQAVTSGIYIWRVESRLGVQYGKLVIIK